jgi:hypothetical protein
MEEKTTGLREMADVRDVVKHSSEAFSRQLSAIGHQHLPGKS